MLGLMNLPAPPTTWATYEKALSVEVQNAAKESMKSAVEEAVLENEGSRDISVALDGSWQKRYQKLLILCHLRLYKSNTHNFLFFPCFSGHVLLNGIVSATSFDSGKVIDISILSKFCRCPEKNNGAHLPICYPNFRGVSGGMEVEGAREIEKFFHVV